MHLVEIIKINTAKDESFTEIFKKCHNLSIEELNSLSQVSGIFIN